MRRMRFRAVGPLLGVVLCALSSTSCGDVVRQGRGSSYLIIDALTGASGAQPDEFGNVLQSDVVTNVKVQVDSKEVMVPTFTEDIGRVTLRLAMKDVTGIIGSGPTSNNEITVTRYHVNYVRSDGRNGQGVDVPYAFDGAITGTIGSATPTTLNFVIVRVQAKREAPLSALQDGGGALIISTIAEVTFYGRDQAGNDVAVTGKMSVNFADWADPQS